MSTDRNVFTEGYFEQNFVNGQWQFPKAPFEYEVRSPVHSAVLTQVPLSSQLDVRAAASAADRALPMWAALDERTQFATRLVRALRQHSDRLIAQQSTEIGLTHSDSAALMRAALRFIEGVNVEGPKPACVEGHILGWGFPVLEWAVSIVPAVLRGATVVVKPSLRAPLTVAALVALMDEAGCPPGVVNLVQGQGRDVGSAMVGEDLISVCAVRGSAATIVSVAGTANRRGRQVRACSGARQVLTVGPKADPERIAAIVSRALRANTAGGPLGLHHLRMHDEIASEFEATLIRELSGCFPAPVINDAFRRRALGSITGALTEGARLITGGPSVPENRYHRMGWHMMPTVLGITATYAARAVFFGGPTITLATWSRASDLGMKSFDADSTLSSETTQANGTRDVQVSYNCGPADALGAGLIGSGWLNSDNGAVQ